ncbi:MAG: lipopolysaccharide biosynthesis protein [Rubrivivax sp.]|jgi:O-antigen/teichoic acid export membrane protein
MALARNALFNLLGAAVPAVLGIITIPYVVRMLGTDGYGLLTLITAIVGYFAVLDVNLTAGSTKYVAQFHAARDHQSLAQTVSFGLAVYAGIGVVGACGLWVGSAWLVTDVFSVAPSQQTVAVDAVRVAALGFFTGQVQAYLQSLPGALMRYDISGRTEAAFGAAVTLLTVLLLAMGWGLVEVVALRVGASVLQALVLVLALRRLLPVFKPAWPDRALRAQLVGFSAFAFLSRLAALTYTHADKLLIGHRVGTAAVAYYAVPSTLANRVMFLVFRLSGVMFPHASALAAQGRLDELREQYLLGSRFLFLLNGLIAVLLAMLAQPLLTLWVGEEFARQGAAVLALVALAQWVDSLTNLPSMVNDGLGHPRVTGLSALARALVGLALVWVGVGWGGIQGAAWGHLVASVLMTIVFVVYVHGRTLPVALPTLLLQAYVRPLLVLLPVGALLWWWAPKVAHWWTLVALGGTAVLLALLLAWLWVLPVDMRQRLLKRGGSPSGRA